MVQKVGEYRTILKVGKIGAKDDILTVQKKKWHIEAIRQRESLEQLHG